MTFKDLFKGVGAMFGIFLIVLAACVIAAMVATAQVDIRLWSSDVRTTTVAAAVMLFIMIMSGMKESK